MCRLTFWLLVGLLGQGLFTARFIVQWLVSERKGDSVVPVTFWWLSLLGGGALLSYAISRHDPVIIVGQVMGLLVYVRNLMLVAQARRHTVLVSCVSEKLNNRGSAHTTPITVLALTGHVALLANAQAAEASLDPR